MTRAAPLEDLDACRVDIWARLRQATRDRRAAGRVLQLATQASDGPRLRSVVLREATESERRLRLHTDRRAPKCAEIAARPLVELCAYDAAAAIQIRMRGAAALHLDDSVAALAWAQASRSARVCYRAAHAPGAELADPALSDPAPQALAPDDDERGFEAFAVVIVTLIRIERLHLASGGHRRACFDWTGLCWKGRWLAP